MKRVLSWSVLQADDATSKGAGKSNIGKTGASDGNATSSYTMSDKGKISSSTAEHVGTGQGIGSDSYGITGKDGCPNIHGSESTSGGKGTRAGSKGDPVGISKIIRSDNLCIADPGGGPNSHASTSKGGGPGKRGGSASPGSKGKHGIPMAAWVHLDGEWLVDTGLLPPLTDEDRRQLRVEHPWLNEFFP